MSYIVPSDVTQHLSDNTKLFSLWAGVVQYSPQLQPGPVGSFHSQEVHGGESPLEEPFPVAGTPLDDESGSSAYTPPATMSNNSK